MAYGLRIPRPVRQALNFGAKHAPKTAHRESPSPKVRQISGFPSRKHDGYQDSNHDYHTAANPNQFDRHMYLLWRGT
jgi:hypothetical protein